MEGRAGMLRYAILALGLLAVGAGCLWLGERGALAIERLMAQRVAHGLAAIGVDWAEVRADGLRLELRGHAPDAAAHALALETARATAPLAAVDDHATVALAPPPRRPAVELELMRDAGGVVMTGRFAGEAMRAALLARLGAEAPSLEVRDLTGINAARPGEGWGPELAVAALAVARVPEAQVRLAPGAVRVAGLARDPAHRAALERALMDAAGETVRLTLELREPPHTAAPFVFAALKGRSGGVRAELCHARDADEAARLDAALARYGAPAGQSRCRVALGGPAGGWAGAVEAGLAALDALPAGALRLEYRTVVLEGGPETPPAAYAGAAQALAAALPEGYSLAAAPSATPEPAGAGEKASPDASFHLRLSRGATGARVDGVVAGETARRLVATYAEARLGPTEVRLEIAQAGAPEGWEPAALVALDGLGRIAEGEAEITPGRLRLAGRVAEPARAGRIHRDLAREAPQGYAVETALTVDLPAAVAAVPPTPARCAALLNAAQTRRPIAFSPGEAVMEPGSGGVLDRLAEILGRCEGARIEVGGHTDDRGPEDLNQRLSRDRAEAVLDALIARGVPLARLSARGYGEAEPVATNATESGRARNRRIDFKALRCAAGPVAC